MSAPSLTKLNNPYLDNDLLESLENEQIKIQKTESMEENNITDDNKENNENIESDAILEGILNLDSIDIKSDEYKRIELNIGGIKYESTLSTLCKYSNSTLCKLILNNIYFIDRDGFIFKYILNFLRNNTLI
eukprot:389408_1